MNDEALLKFLLSECTVSEVKWIEHIQPGSHMERYMMENHKEVFERAKRMMVLI